MSAVLAVRLLLAPGGEPDEAVIVGDIRPSDLSGTSRRGILIPCGSSPSPRSYPVEPGRYVVSASLPSGLVLTEGAVAVEGRETPVDFAMTDSPYGTHSWQYLMGNIEPGGVYHGAARSPLAQSVASRPMVATASRPDGTVSGGAVDPTALATWVGDSAPACWSFASMLALAQAPPGTSVAGSIGSGGSRVLPAPLHPAGAVTPLYRFGPDGPLGAPGGPVGERQFLVVEAAGSVRLATLPLPWGEAEAEVLVNLRPSPTGSAVSVAVRDADVGAGLAYMAQGALDTAARLFADVEATLYSRLANPLAAAAGCYVLLGTDHSPGATRWDPWLERLADGFPWLGDGAILRAVRLLRRARGDPGQVRRGRDGLIEAFDRGIPFYTLGLAWLVDGLAAFPEDPGCARRLDAARRLSWLVDTREPFLILDLRQRRT
ncbi:hypothetical protein [Streptomyces lavendulae]|uniref:hypothetical protein n=1 Tax=Streptomyces lavendulae TaxID=1914 RepID=UPI0024A378EA|nr:hypothetical protein [Streptomyces lavendulae]GLW03392.1 hypothetical protein Slala05_70220 [Streptomyces lavendulae subsp. lavendulae]